MSKTNYRYWNKELDAIAAGFVPSIDAPSTLSRDTSDEPVDGYWRIMAARTKADAPVAIWHDGERVMLKIGRRDPMDNEAPDFAAFFASSWPKCAAVLEADYHRALETGIWPGDGKQSRQMSEEERLDIIPTTPADQGGNMVDDEGKPIDPQHQAILLKATSLVDKANELKSIDTMDKAEKAASIVTDTRSLAKIAENKRVAEKEPHRLAADAVDAKWAPILNALKAATKAMVDAIDAFQRAEAARLRRIAEEEAEAERQRIAAETAKRLESQGATEEEQAAAAEEAAAAVETVKVEPIKVSSAHGRAVSKAKRKVGVITDEAAFIDAIKGGEDFAAWLQTKADAIARSKTPVAGMKIVDA